MRLRKILLCLVAVFALVFARQPAHLSAQIYYQCPDGYYYDPNYGCLPLSYFYGPPAYVFPFAGFGFFYGGNWGHGGGYARGGGGHPGGGGHGR